MPKRETQKIVEIKGRRWRISKFDAMTGSYVSYKLLFQMLPGNMESSLQDQTPNAMNLPKDRPLMGKQEFFELQKDCLAVCHELIMVGDSEQALPIFLNGQWARPELEDDVMTIMALTVHALIFNVTGFFEGDALKELIRSFRDNISLTASNLRT